jgi:hypothetical protein
MTEKLASNNFFNDERTIVASTAAATDLISDDEIEL